MGNELDPAVLCAVKIRAWDAGQGAGIGTRGTRAAASRDRGSAGAATDAGGGAKLGMGKGSSGIHWFQFHNTDTGPNSVFCDVGLNRVLNLANNKPDLRQIE